MWSQSLIVRFLLWSLLSLVCASAKKGTARNIKVSVSDKNYTVSGVSTVGELQLRIQQESGIEPILQGNVMFGEKRLSPMDRLKDVGVSNGSLIHIVSTVKRKSQKESLSTTENTGGTRIWDKLVAFALDCLDETRRLGKNRWKNDVPQAVVDLMALVQKVTRSSLFEEYMADPKELYDEIERMRQFTKNSQIADTMQLMPIFMKRALEDPETWRKLTLWNIQAIKRLELDGPLGEKLLLDLRKMEATGLLTNLPSGFYNFINGQDDDL